MNHRLLFTSSAARVVGVAGLLAAAGPAVLAGLFAAAVPCALAGQSAGERLERTIPGTEVGFTEVFVPAGSFLIGSAEDEPGRDADEGPRTTVSLSGFWMFATEVTQAEYGVFRRRRLDTPDTDDPDRTFDVDAVTRPSPPYEDPAHGMGGPQRPATGMTQYAALEFARWLSLKTGRLYRLPTEAEWEYACRAGLDGVIATDTSAWTVANSGETTHDAASLEPNAWGLFDMLGNVAEWTLDEYAADAYRSWGEDVVDPWNRPTRTHPRTVRGGAFDDVAEDVRCAERLESTLDWKRRDPQIPKSRWWNTDSPHVGFRLVRPEGDRTLAEIEAYFAELIGPGD